ncbi:platelet-derived growth factor receptor-like protein [Bombina bombina]|uniref:platelet-derived growth factor receptor-like protein n=1 Tax=Bombina bombina TaxID=8345 RepID=UPI00235AAF46|nr:platelet-derived growth factor receptor-like protein [Bombina bombina]
MKFWYIFCLILVHEALQNVLSQPAVKGKRSKEPAENKIKPAIKKLKPKITKLKESTENVPKVQSIMTQVLDKGRFQKAASMMSMTAGQSMELRCKGEKIAWSYPEYLVTFRDSRLSIKQHDRYGQLILANSTAADTGEFSCWAQVCDRFDCKKDESKTGSTYIFFTDKGELFVPSPSYFEIIYLHPDKPTIIPCRVTIPSAKVTLHREFPAEEIKADGTAILYDVKKGFVYQHPQSNQSGVVYCRAENKGAPQISIKYQLLYVEVPSGPPSATITASTNKVRSGDDFSIFCTVLGEPDVEVEFTWIYPGQEYERPVAIQDSWRLVNRGIGHTTRISNSVISIEDFETIDAGYYICKAQNLRGQTTLATRVDRF